MALASSASPHTIEFIEFAVNPRERDALTKLLGGLGFSRTGQHKQKQVERWQQGQINLVINQEPESHAQSYHGQHGLSVCAYGLAVNSPDSLMQRADQLNYPRQRGNPLKDTHGLEAVAGPTGALLYAIDANDPQPHWSREFAGTDAQPQAI